MFLSWDNMSPGQYVEGQNVSWDKMSQDKMSPNQMAPVATYVGTLCQIVLNLEKPCRYPEEP